MTLKHVLAIVAFGALWLAGAAQLMAWGAVLPVVSLLYLMDVLK